MKQALRPDYYNGTVAKIGRQNALERRKRPYKIWLSEIILQQTRVEQGLEYYNRFVHTFPLFMILRKLRSKKYLSYGRDWVTIPL
jgi:hypothetical protein